MDPNTVMMKGELASLPIPLRVSLKLFVSALPIGPFGMVLFSEIVMLP